MKHTIAAIAAMDEGRVIGIDNKLPWSIPEDLKRFSALTTGHTVLMGRNTYDSLPPKYRPLPKRLNIVISRNQNLPLPKEVLQYASPEVAIRDFLADKINAPTSSLWIVGGAQIYQATRPYWTELYLTLVHSRNKGDTYFPDFEKDFTLVENDDRSGFSFQLYKRKRS